MYTQRFSLFFCLMIASSTISFGMNTIQELRSAGSTTTKKYRRTKKEKSYNLKVEPTDKLRARIQTLITKRTALQNRLHQQEKEKKAVNIDRVLSGFEINNARESGHQPTHSRVISHQVHTEIFDRKNRKLQKIRKEIDGISARINTYNAELRKREKQASSKTCIIL